jgi:cytochrome P450
VSVLGSTDAWKQIHGHERCFIKDPAFYIRFPDTVEDIVLSQGASHARQRKIISKAFSEKALKEHEPLLRRWAAKFVEKLGERKGQPTNIVMMYNCACLAGLGSPQPCDSRS